ncbi:MAG: AAA family ATPase [Clostridia bacterium]|nr:AAA family ATPase [Clostridia bacterium]
MLKEELIKERRYLNKVKKEIKNQKEHYAEQLNSLEKQKSDLSKLYADDFYYMDDEEAVGEGARLAEFDTIIKYTEDNISRLNRQEYSPYFGRIDWQENGTKKAEPYYVGVNNLVSDGKLKPMVCDWRAPICSLFYDYELGDASYVAPDGEFNGKISLKRQYEIKDGNLVKAFDSSLTIGDEILKDVLSKNASSKMKNVVSTIQKEQNRVIRYNANKNMLVQGVAGSGKTTIALHRVAYLLYQHKNTLKAEDVLILSPNKLFSEYIAGVLPELGEENMSQMSFYRLVQTELKFLGFDFEKREDNIDELLKDSKRLNEVAYKHTYDFYESLQQFCSEYFNLIFKPKDMRFGEQVITAKELENLYYNTYKSKTPAVRVDWLVDYILDKLEINEEIVEISKKIKLMLYPFFEQTNIIKIYADFLTNIGMCFSFNGLEQIRYDDFAPLLYIANYFLGLNKHSEVKYLIIDEMQDYSFVAYAVFNQIFDCNKTVLGDINQCIEKIMTYDDLKKLKEMLNAEYVELNKAYRSTKQITEFANNLKCVKCSCVARAGDAVQEILEKDVACKIEQLVAQNSQYGSVAILTKDKNEARELFVELGQLDGVTLNVDYESQVGKVCIMPSYMAKGLEFDMVIVANAQGENYCSVLEKNLLYVSCTRALHKLCLLKTK